MRFRRLFAFWAIVTACFLAGCGGGGGGTTPNPPPSATLSYTSPQIYVVGTAIASLAPVTTASLSGFSSSPALPLGLTLDASTGVISGTPTAVGSCSCKITASTSSGQSVSAVLNITVNAVGANVISYGASALTFTAGLAAQTLTPETAASSISGWSISPQLPAGLTFSTASGVITGTPTAVSPPMLYTVQAHGSTGALSGQLTIQVDNNVLLDLGHNGSITYLGFNGSSVLSVDQNGHWVLWNYASAAQISSGTNCSYDTPPTGARPCVRGPDAALAGTTAVIRAYNGFQVLSATTGAVIANISITLDSASEDTGGSWWMLATDGSYIVAGTTSGLSVWSSSGQLLYSRSGVNYSAALAAASPGTLHIAEGPAGSNVVENIALPGGTDTISPSFNGQFASWFADGSAFFSTVGSTELVYTSAAVQEATLSTASGPYYGDGPWLWTYASPGMVIYALSAPTVPVTSYSFPAGVSASQVIGSIIVLESSNGNNAVSIVDLSGATPIEANYTSPVLPGLVGAVSASSFVLGGSWGLLLDGASLSGTPRYFGYGQALAVAANASQIAIATAVGKILFFNATTLQQEGSIPYLSTQLALSPDGTILAAAPASLYGLPASASLNIYSLPTGSLTYSWPAGAVTDISLAGSGPGTVLGQASGTGVMISAPTGGTPSFSATGQGVLDIAPDVTSVATSSTVNPAVAPIDWVGFGTNLYQNATLVTAVDGWPVGWVDNTHLLVNSYQPNYFIDTQTDYVGCALYGPTGASAGTCSLPQVLSFQTVTSDTLYALNLNAIASLTTGAESWASGDPLAPTGFPSPTFLDGLAGNHVVFVSGSKFVAQSY